MPYRVTAAAVGILLGSLLWTGRLAFQTSRWDSHSATLLAAGLLLATAVNVVALLLSPGRWVRNSVAVIAGAWAVVAIALPVDMWWIMALVTHGAGVTLAWTRSLDSWFLQVKPDRVPTRATMLALGLIWLPAVVGGLGDPGVSPSGWVLVAFGWLGGWAYARALPGALWLVRLGLLPLGIVSVLGLQPVAAAGLLVTVSTLTFLAWTADARLAVMPLDPHRVSSVSILPELTPPGLMEAAGYDRRGRPLERNG